MWFIDNVNGKFILLSLDVSRLILL